MLKKGDVTTRFGPVLQRGYISAIAPYEGSSLITEILLDARTAGGMSGSPVFTVDDGKVIGIHNAGWEATTACAIPINKDKIENWYNFHIKLSANQFKRPEFPTI